MYFVYGTTGLGREVMSYLSRKEPIIGGFISDIEEKKVVNGQKVYRPEELAKFLKRDDIDVVIAFGDGKFRVEIADKLISMYAEEINFPNVFFNKTPFTWYGDECTFGRGNIICPGVMFSCNDTIGDFNLFNFYATLGHDIEIGSGCSLSPACNIGGTDKIGNFVSIGMNAVTRENLTIGNNSVIGAGAVVVKDVEPNKMVVGNPAKVIKDL